MYRHVHETRGARRLVYGLEQHRPPVLIEEFGRGVDVVVGARVGPADDHDGIPGGGARVVDAVVVDGRLEEVSVCFEPVCSHVSGIMGGKRVRGGATIWGCSGRGGAWLRFNMKLSIVS